MTYRLTKVDWDLINEALACFEAEVEAYGDKGEVYEDVDLRRLRETRKKVHAKQEEQP